VTPIGKFDISRANLAQDAGLIVLFPASPPGRFLGKRFAKSGTRWPSACKRARKSLRGRNDCLRGLTRSWGAILSCSPKMLANMRVRFAGT
jgi:hypothetical protein